MVGCYEPDARWQVAEYLGLVEGDRAKADGRKYVVQNAVALEGQQA